MHPLIVGILAGDRIDRLMAVAAPGHRVTPAQLRPPRGRRGRPQIRERFSRVRARLLRTA